MVLNLNDAVVLFNQVRLLTNLKEKYFMYKVVTLVTTVAIALITFGFCADTHAISAHKAEQPKNAQLINELTIADPKHQLISDIVNTHQYNLVAF